ncbi:MAG: maleylpyruvate isomerase family mycothiol-dependent enzyme [Trebonia sp.]
MDDYATALTGQNRMLAELLRDADWSVPVPTCPGWTLLQLLRHVGRGDRWAAQIIADRVDASLDPRLVREGRPPADAPGAIGWLSQSPLTVLAAVDAIGPGTEVSTFVGPKAAAWWIRRRLHEATVHRADAAIALGATYELSAELAADGISEWLERLADEQALGQSPALPAGASLALRATDRDLTESTWTVLGRPEGGPGAGQAGRADLTLSGPATDLLLALLRRRPVEDTRVSLEGDTELWRSWLANTPL